MMEKSDGRWAWMVVLAAASIRVLLYGITNTSGVVYMVILDVFMKSKGATAWITSVVTAATFLTCPFAGMLVNRFGLRPVALCGGIIASTGLLISAFATSLPVLAIFYGVVTGIGCGLTFIPGSVAVALYFTKRRNLAMGLAAAGGGVGSFVFPPIVKLLDDQFGWRGMFMILSGVVLNVVVFALLYRPVEQSTSIRDSLLSLNTPGVKNNWGFFKKIDFYVVGLSNVLFQFGASVIFGHMGNFASEGRGIDKTRSMLLFSCIGISTTFAKVAQGCILDKFKKWKCCQPYFVYIYSYLIGGVAVMFLLLDIGYEGMVVVNLLFGLSYAASGGAIIPAILIHMETVEQLSLTYGVILALQALGFLLGSPAAGFIIDNYRSYDVALLLSAICIILSAVITIFPCRNFYQVEKQQLGKPGTSITVMISTPDLTLQVTGSGMLHGSTTCVLGEGRSMISKAHSKTALNGVHIEKNGTLPQKSGHKLEESQSLIIPTAVSADSESVI